MGCGMKGHAMKVAAILVTTALAVGTSAFGQTRDAESIGQKADRVFDRMENATRRGIDKVRGTGNKAKNKVENTEARRDTRPEAEEARREVKQEAKEAKRDAQRDETRSMGAGRSDQRAGPGDRQARMDDAYGNWKNQQRR